MMIGATTVWRLARGAALVALLVLVHQATAAELRVLSTGAPAVAAKVLAERFSQQSGDDVAFTVGQPDTVRDKLAAGVPADIVIAPAPLMAALEKGEKLRAGSSLALARVGIGVVVREGAPRPDIATPEAVRELLLAARSVAFPNPEAGGGFAGKALTRMIGEMGIMEAVKPKLTLAYAITGGVDLVADGKVEVGLFNISEILPVKGITLVGPLPPQLQSYIVFAAGIPAGAAAAEPAAAFIAAMARPAARDAWTAAGMEPLGGNQESGN